MILELLHLMRGFLQPVDLGVYVLERVRISRAEELSTCGVGDLFQRLLIDVDLSHREALITKGIGHRHRSFAPDTGSDGINLHTKRLRGLRRRLGRDFAHIVFTVGEQHDDFRFARLITETVHARGECGTDGSAIFYGTDLDTFKVLLEPVVIERQRTYEVRRAGESDQTD